MSHTTVSSSAREAPELTFLPHFPFSMPKLQILTLFYNSFRSSYDLGHRRQQILDGLGDGFLEVFVVVDGNEGAAVGADDVGEGGEPVGAAEAAGRAPGDAGDGAERADRVAEARRESGGHGRGRVTAA